ncbi:hypothetical protein SAMN05443246_3387 [Paenibacillus sp. GP183]|nr:hypothetical protein SAMN05443246_3387 [Paenibacillus sp. GP183]
MDSELFTSQALGRLLLSLEEARKFEEKNINRG